MVVPQGLNSEVEKGKNIGDLLHPIPPNTGIHLDVGRGDIAIFCVAEVEISAVFDDQISQKASACFFVRLPFPPKIAESTQKSPVRKPKDHAFHRNNQGRKFGLSLNAGIPQACNADASINEQIHRALNASATNRNQQG